MRNNYGKHISRLMRRLIKIADALGWLNEVSESEVRRALAGRQSEKPGKCGQIQPSTEYDRVPLNDGAILAQVLKRARQAVTFADFLPPQIEPPETHNNLKN
jgi:hypothetical protein